VWHTGFPSLELEASLEVAAQEKHSAKALPRCEASPEVAAQEKHSAKALP
jgi:hypothetical protein